MEVKLKTVHLCEIEWLEIELFLHLTEMKKWGPWNIKTFIKMI